MGGNADQVLRQKSRRERKWSGMLKIGWYPSGRAPGLEGHVVLELCG